MQDDKQALTQCYKTMYQGMIAKNFDILNEVLDDSFVLIHMTGLRQPKKEYYNSIKIGQLNYFKETTENLSISIDGDNAQVVGKSVVEAAVFGGGRNTWNLQQSLKAIRNNGKWLFTESVASSYY